ncbi:vesicular inhibitory amino acid transporter [Alosa sapidissima]|uniref:vesicular inhibitory amino acid transporter n=1 Tax=Alosa sapidissima TaxID=34773 RepID=UPI001C084608|nr:vesicular inhibitory amino acid transporter [Alosa sapidissima]
MSSVRLSWLGAHGRALWSSRFLAGDEESQAFAHRDELSKSYGEAHAGEPGKEPCGSSPETSEDLQAEGFHRGSPEGTCPKITTWEAGWNVTNAIQGIFVLGLPYALLQSGYLGFLLLVLAAVICSYTGKILIACLYEEDESGQLVRVRDTYEDIANACCRHVCPRLGGRVVHVAQVVELMMTCILYLVVSSNLMCHSFSFLPLSPGAWSAVTFLSLVPCMLIRDLRVVSRLSLLCSLAQFLITFVTVGFCLQQAHRWSWRRMSLWVDAEKFLVSVGVIIFSYTSQIFLPTLEGSMEERGDFADMLTWTHALACVLKTLFSVLAFLTWGEETKEVITDNLPDGLRLMVNLCLLAKALLSYPLPFYAASEVLQGCMLNKENGAAPEAAILALRAGLLMLTFLMAMYVPHFSLLMGLTGSVTGAAMTFLLPSLFHLQLKWTTLDGRLKAINFLILVLGSLCSLSGVICSIKGMIEAFESK